VRDKRKITDELVALLPDRKKISADSAMRSWWFNLRKNGGMRLTGPGHQTFVQDLALEHYEYALLYFGLQRHTQKNSVFWKPRSGHGQSLWKSQTIS
jgi:hypothetical protein